MIQLNDDQQEGYNLIYDFLKNKKDKLFVLTGSAGTGKTTLITEIMKHNNIFKKKIVLSATTNKAVSVIQKIYKSSPKNVHFSTIHKLMQIKRTINMDGSESYIINIDESPNQKKKSIYFYDIIVIDEASMISKDLVSEIINISSKIKGKIIFVGDTLQLPPINEEISEVFNLSIKKFNLSKIERSKNNIVKYSNQLRDHIINGSKIKYKSFLDNNVSIIKNLNDWVEKYIEIFKQDTNSILLAYTNAQCSAINKKVRNYLFDYPKEKYIKGELIVFNNFYSNNLNKYYSSQHLVIDSINISQYQIEEFPMDCLFNLKLDMNKKEDIDSILRKKEKKENNDLLCPICYENDVEFGETTCGHAFCFDCIKLWLRNNKCCPYCRMTLIDDNLTIKNDNELSSIINILKTKIDSMNYKIWEIKGNDNSSSSNQSIIPSDVIRVIHSDDSLKYKKDLEFINDNLVNLRNILKKKKEDRLVKIILQRLWEFYYYRIIDQFADISYGYCITIHKSQGSTYNNVFIDLDNVVRTNHDKNQMIKSVYTAVTRASLKLKLFIK